MVSGGDYPMGVKVTLMISDHYKDRRYPGRKGTTREEEGNPPINKIENIQREEDP